MLTKKQKAEYIKEGKDILKNSHFLVFIDFTKTSVEDLKKLRRVLRDAGAKLKVIKKRLLNIAFKESGFDFDHSKFESQIGTIFSEKDIPEIAASVYKFSKEINNKEFKILGGYDLSAKNFLEAEFVKMLGQLPPREILLSQLVGMLQSPISKLLYVLNEKSKMVENK
ncbi:MAG: 50S ribosomal protein L10 [Patescibacteria group bacterium]